MKHLLEGYQIYKTAALGRANVLGHIQSGWVIYYEYDCPREFPVVLECGRIHSILPKMDCLNK